MELPGQRKEAAKEERVLIWGAGGAVGGYAVQYAKSVGYIVIATASPAWKKHLEALGASAVLDYKSEHTIGHVRKLGPYAFMFTTSGDPQSQKSLGLLLQPEGGTFASTLAGDVELPSNVKRVYEKFSMITQSDEAKNRDFARWWYGEYLGKAIRERIVQPSLFEKRHGGLKVVQRAADDVVEGRTRAKLVINPQED
jgi:NADPH:quinone reductase-like Zn-dependent oxidoreductase